MKSTLQIIISMIIWGSVGIFVRFVNMPSLEIAFMRAAIAAFFLLIIWLIKKNSSKKKYDKKNIFLLILSGAAMGLNWVLLFQAYKYTTIANATLSYYFAPVFIILLSPIVLKEKFTLAKLLAVSGAMIGLFFILGSQSSPTIGQYNHIKGMLFGISAAILYASVVLLNKYIKNLSGFDMTLIQITTAAIVLLPMAIKGGNLHFESMQTIVLLAIVGIVHTGIAYLLYFSAIKHIPAQSAAILSYIDPVSAILFGTLLLSEPIGLMQILGGCLILLSTFLGELKKKTT